MGKRVRGGLDLLSGQTGAMMVLGLAFLLCGLAGIFLAGRTEQAGCDETKLFLEEAFRLIREGNAMQPFWNLLWVRLRLLIPVLVLSTTPLGVPGIPLLFGWLGFRFAWPVGCLFRIYGLAALYPAFALFGLAALLWFPLLFWTGSRGLLSAQRRLKDGGSGESGGSDPGVLFRQLVCCVLFVVCVLIEYFAAPVLLRAAAQAVL